MSELVLKIEQARNSEDSFALLVEEYQSRILAWSSRVVNHFVSTSDDEWSVALIAFHEAVQSYDDSKGDFAAFCRMIIGRRLTDYLRREYRHVGEVSVEPVILAGGHTQDEDEEGYGLAGGEASAVPLAADEFWPGKYSVADEIEAVQDHLREYGFSFFDVAEASPKSRKTKVACVKAVAALLTTPELLRFLKESRALPMKALVEKSGVKKKILERHRRYIITAVVILNGEYPLLAEYMDEIRKAMVT